MVASSFNSSGPFLTYLTVFKARIASLNLILPLSGFAFQSPALLARRARAILDERALLVPGDPENAPVFDYLNEKSLIGTVTRESGRYKDFTLHKTADVWGAKDRRGQPLDRLSVFKADIWLADPRIRSTVGVPTPENVNEVLELCYQLKVISKAKSTLTSAGQLAVQLRSYSSTLGIDTSNPMLLALDQIVLLRQMLHEDGLITRETLARLGPVGNRVTRDQIASQLYTIAEAAMKRAESLEAPPPVVREGREFLRLLGDTRKKKEKKDRDSSGTTKHGGPGVFEHRTAPRLEWLTDFGVLAKNNLPRNGFTYIVTGDAGLLASLLDAHVGNGMWSDNVALEYWRQSMACASLRGSLSGATPDVRQALLRGYSLMKRTIGPAPMREVCFGAAILSPKLGLRVEELSSQLVELARYEKGITLSGGRFTRAPEFVHIPPEMLPR